MARDSIDFGKRSQPREDEVAFGSLRQPGDEPRRTWCHSKPHEVKCSTGILQYTTLQATTPQSLTHKAPGPVLPARRLLDAFGFGRLAGFGSSPFLERGSPTQFHAAFIVDADAFHPDHLADLGNVFGAVHPEIS